MRTLFDPDNSVFPLWIPNRNTISYSWWCPQTSVNWSRSIFVGMESCISLHAQNVLHDRTNTKASFDIKPLGIAGFSCPSQLPAIRYTCPDNHSNAHYLSIVISLSYSHVSIWRILSDVCECGYAWFLKLPLPITPLTSAAFITGVRSIEWCCLTIVH